MDWAAMGPARFGMLRSAVSAALDVTRQRWSTVIRRAALPTDLRVEAHRLLEMHSRAGFVAGDTVSEPSQPRSQSIATGTVIAGRYRVEGMLGAGGMGEVYRCFDSTAGIYVALKVLRPAAGADGNSVKAFRRELQLGLKLQHENLVRIFHIDTAQLAGGASITFITMELLEGKTLEEFVAGRVLSSAEALPIVRGIADGLAKVHAAGIVHRDLKCSNVMLVPQKASGNLRPVLTDFGLACEYGSAEEVITAITQGQIAGTPDYMAPEQFAGAPVTPAADIYALGVMMFRMRTGRLPFQGPNLFAAAARRFSSEAPSPRLYNKHVERRWVRAIAACLELEPKRRPHSAGAVVTMVDGTAERTFQRRAALASGAAVLGSAAVWLYAGSERQPPAADPEVVRHWRLGRDLVRARNREQLTEAVVEFERALAVDANHAPSWIGLAEAYATMANWGLADHRSNLQKAQEAARRAVAIDANSGLAHAVLGYTVSIDVSRWRDAGQHFQQALRLAPAEPDVLFWHAAHLSRLGRHSEAIETLRRFLSQSPGDLAGNHQLATEYLRARRYADYLQQAEELIRVHPFHADSHLARARALERLGRYEEALDACREALRFKIDRPQLLSALSSIHAARGDRSQARAHAEELLSLYRTRPMEGLTVAMTFAFLGDENTAVDLLEEGIARGDSTVLKAATSPYFDPVRNGARFRRFLASHGF